MTKYIAAFAKDSTGLCSHCYGDAAISAIEPLDVSKLQELEDCPEDILAVGDWNFKNHRSDWLKILIEDKTEINPTSNGNAVRIRRFRYYAKNNLLLIPMPPEMEELMRYLPDLKALVNT